ncbi:MAG: GC-type dockerin domain-anchored protein, partial [Phycisphaerales bacterium]
ESQHRAESYAPARQRFRDRLYSGTDPDGLGVFWTHALMAPSTLTPQRAWQTWLQKYVTPCSLDFTGEGRIDERDAAAYLTRWQARDSSADLNNDGVVDHRDLHAFLGYVDGVP